MTHPVTAILFLVAALVSQSTSAPRPVLENDISILCPSMFANESRDKPGQWSGRLTLKSDEELHGIWVRLVFDKEIRIEVEGDYQVTQEKTLKKQILIKNRDVVLKANQEMPLKITVNYDGDEVPNLIEYRLNARTMCPNYSTSLSDFYLGDFNSTDFLSKIQTTKGSHLDSKTVLCGAISSSSYPWHASLFINEKFVCEAILINDFHILTPAHCVSTKTGDKPIFNKLISVYLGDNGASKNAFRAEVSEIFIHPAYNGNSLNNDLAVLKLEEKVPISDSLMPICLRDSDKEGSLLTGYDVNDQNSKGPVQSAKVKKISDEECLKKAADLRNTLIDDTFCVVYDKEHSNCVGNSGSSFVSLENDKVYLKGFVSVGVKLQNKNECNENTVAVVTDTTRYSKWIKKMLLP